MKRAIWLLSFSAVVLSACMAQGQKDQRPDGRHFAVLDVIIGKTDFAGLQQRLGPVKQCRVEEEHTSIARYQLDKEELVFEFSVVGGGTVTGFYFGPPGWMEPCPPSPLPSRVKGVSTSGGVHLGMKDAELIRLFGQPEKKNKQGQWDYYWEWEREMTDEEKKQYASDRPGQPIPAVSVAITIQVTFSNGTLRSFYISKLEVL